MRACPQGARCGRACGHDEIAKGDACAAVHRDMSNAATLITTEAFYSTIHKRAMYFAHGPGQHRYLLAADTAQYAAEQGLAYFLRTRAQDANGAWVIV